ncbi:MAG: hypothetical protein OMM_10795 [Candidatus Magnetoglobus multicellularis str. Araruama]|uniref:Uncharacterized protein n=1 Tax=Candidatus Magnetoglobus multicellularis str. Araruama TaxID=890399 RepID=A0A1V1NZY3_9BACT|nr:MAG: hypothetical protein OMM_10795 [Candidatus Magnetoglobus multicellularis str. Araruama]
MFIKKGLDLFRKELAYFCAAVRLTQNPNNVHREEIIKRERFMRKNIQTEIAKHNVLESEVMVVCGGYHIYMDNEDQQDPPPIPKGTIYTTIVPYSFFRISEYFGYAAGNRAPQFYQMLWESGKGSQLYDTMINYIVKVLKQGRKQGETYSPADGIAIVQTATMLSNLRNRKLPILDDINDALITCCCKGKPQEEGYHLLKAIKKIAIGNKVGYVTKNLAKLPILNDFYIIINELGLSDSIAKDNPKKLSLDRREDLDSRQSSFFHRLLFLQIPFVKLLESPGTGLASGTLFKEKWNLNWSPKVEQRLIEMNLFGDSIESAALTRLKENLKSVYNRAGDISQKLVQTVNMDFPNLIADVELICGESIDNDTNFISLCQALTNLLILDRYALFRNIQRDRLINLIERCFDRSCFALPFIASAPEDMQDEIVSSLLGITEAIQHSGRGDFPELDQEMFLQNLKQAAEISEVHFLKGVFWGIIAEMRKISSEELSKKLADYANEQPEQMIMAGDFLDGLMSVSRISIMLGASQIIESIEKLLTVSDWDSFLVMLPKMRSAFERLHKSQRDNIADLVAQRNGLQDADQLTELNTSVEAAVIIARIDKQVSEIMQDWSFL